MTDNPLNELLRNLLVGHIYAKMIEQVEDPDHRQKMIEQVGDCLLQATAALDEIDGEA